MHMGGEKIVNMEFGNARDLLVKKMKNPRPTADNSYYFTAYFAGHC